MLAVIPARLGSKGLARKNILIFAGLPMIAHSIKFAGMCPEIGRCVVSTESEEIAEIARAHGGDVPFLRPAELAADDSPTSPVLQHALHQVEQQEGKTYGSILLLQPTSPARLPPDLTQAITILEADTSAAGVVAVAETTFNPRYVCVQQGTEALKMAFADANSDEHYERRQNVPGVYRITGSLYLWRRDYVHQCGEINLDRDRHRLLLIPKERVIDIDDLFDFRVAELAVTSGICALPWLSTEQGAAKA